MNLLPAVLMLCGQSLVFVVLAGSAAIAETRTSSTDRRVITRSGGLLLTDADATTVADPAAGAGSSAKGLNLVGGQPARLAERLLKERSTIRREPAAAAVAASAAQSGALNAGELAEPAECLRWSSEVSNKETNHNDSGTKNRLDQLLQACNAQKEARRKEAREDREKIATECKDQNDKLEEAKKTMEEKCRESFPGQGITGCAKMMKECEEKLKDPETEKVQKSITAAVSTLAGANPNLMAVDSAYKAYEQMQKDSNRYLPKECRASGLSREKLMEMKDDLETAVRKEKADAQTTQDKQSTILAGLTDKRNQLLKAGQTMTLNEANQKERMDREKEAADAARQEAILKLAAQKNQLQMEIASVQEQSAQQLSPMGQGMVKSQCQAMLEGRSPQQGQGAAGLSPTGEKIRAGSYNQQYRILKKWLPQCISSTLNNNVRMALMQVQAKERQIAEINQRLNSEDNRAVIEGLRAQSQQARVTTAGLIERRGAGADLQILNQQIAQATQSAQVQTGLASTNATQTQIKLAQVTEALNQATTQNGDPMNANAAVLSFNMRYTQAADSVAAYNLLMGLPPKSHESIPACLALERSFKSYQKHYETLVKDLVQPEPESSPAPAATKPLGGTT